MIILSRTLLTLDSALRGLSCADDTDRSEPALELSAGRRCWIIENGSLETGSSLLRVLGRNEPLLGLCQSKMERNFDVEVPGVRMIDAGGEDGGDSTQSTGLMPVVRIFRHNGRTERRSLPSSWVYEYRDAGGRQHSIQESSSD